MPIAMASSSSSRRFLFGRERSLGIIRATAALSAPPWPVTASFTCWGEHSITGREVRPAAARMAPRASATPSAVFLFYAEEERLDGERAWRVLGDRVGDSTRDAREPLLARAFIGEDTLAPEERRPRRISLDHGDAEAIVARVNRQYSHRLSSRIRAHW